MKLFKEEKTGLYWHYCPACGSMHEFYVDTPTLRGARWTFNGDYKSPTFAPSMHIKVGPNPYTNEMTTCHYFLKDGKIQYLSDCYHEYAGKTIDLPEIPKGKLSYFKIEKGE